jgi:hypothetical protein
VRGDLSRTLAAIDASLTRLAAFRDHRPPMPAFQTAAMQTTLATLTSFVRSAELPPRCLALGRHDDPGADQTPLAADARVRPRHSAVGDLNTQSWQGGRSWGVRPTCRRLDRQRTCCPRLTLAVMEAARVRLETLYTLTARLSGLGLAGWLR